jgi:type VI secretion system protein ImpB
MAKEATVAPKERVNIVYRPASGDAMEEVELPFRLMVIGDFTMAQDDRLVEEREPINIDKNNFNEVLKAQQLKLQFNVDDALSSEEGGQMSVDLKFENLKDFNPDQLVKQVPELAKLMELREALRALRGPLGNVRAFRNKLKEIISDQGARERLLKELGLEE